MKEGQKSLIANYKLEIVLLLFLSITKEKKLKKAIEKCRTQVKDVAVPIKKYDALKNYAAEREKENKETGITAFGELMCTKKYSYAENIKEVEKEAGIKSDSLKSAEGLLSLCGTIDSYIRNLIKCYDDAYDELVGLEKGRLKEAKKRLIQTYDRDLKHARSWAKIATNDALKANRAMLSEGKVIVGQIDAIRQIKTDKKMMNNSVKKYLHELYKQCSNTHEIQKEINGYLLSWIDTKGYREKNVKNYFAEKLIGEAPLPTPAKGKELIGKLENFSEAIRSNLSICRDADGSGNNDAGGSGNRRDNDAGGSGNNDAGGSGNNDAGGSGNRRDNDAKRKARTELYELLEVYLNHVFGEEVYYLRRANEKHEKVHNELGGYMLRHKEVSDLQEEWKKKNEQFQKCEDDLNRAKGYAQRVLHNYHKMREAAIRENPQLLESLLEQRLPAVVQFEYEKSQQKKLQDQETGSSKPPNVAHQFAKLHLDGVVQETGSSKPPNVAHQFAEFLGEVAQETGSSKLTDVAHRFAELLGEVAQETGSSKLTNVARRFNQTFDGVVQETGSKRKTEKSMPKRRRSDEEEMAD